MQDPNLIPGFWLFSKGYSKVLFRKTFFQNRRSAVTSSFSFPSPWFWAHWYVPTVCGSRCGTLPFPEVCINNPGQGHSYHGQWDDANQVLLAHVDLGDAQVRCDVSWIFNLPGNKLCSWRVTGLLDFYVDLHDFIGGTIRTGEKERTTLRTGVGTLGRQWTISMCVRIVPAKSLSEMRSPMSTDRWIDKEDVVHLYSGMLLSHKIEWNNAICSNMDGPRDYHTKWSKPEKDKYPMIPLTCGI